MKRLVSLILVILLIFICISKINITYATTASTTKLKIVLDPGHGGSMPGAVNETRNIIESECTIKVARYLKSYLEKYDGVEVILTHNGDLASDYELEISERGMIARRNNADLFVSLHFNASTNMEANGAEVFVSASKVLPKYNEETTKLGNKILDNLHALGIYNRGVQTRLCNDTGPEWEYSDGTRADYYGVIRYAMKGDGKDRGVDIEKGEGVPAILVEHCFINGIDAVHMESDESLKELAIADGKAIVDHYGLRLKSEAVQEISLNKATATIDVNEEITFIATVKPDTAKNKNVKWSSSNNKIATVDSTGKVKGISPGEVTITATTEDKGLKAVAYVTVEDERVILNTESTSMLVNEKIQLLSSVVPNTLEDKTVLWSTSDETKAVVDQNGIVTAIAEGNVTITATLKSNNYQSKVNLNINSLNEEESIQINKYKEEYGFISKLDEKITKEEFLKNIVISKGLKVDLVNTYINEDKQELIATGTLVRILDKETDEVLKEYTCLLYGDINGDSRITPADSTLVLREYVNLEQLSVLSKVVANTNGDSRITPADSTVILRAYVGLSSIDL